jgi:hypothetical protein
MMRQAAISLEEMILMKCFKVYSIKKPLLEITEAFLFCINYLIKKQSPSFY